MQCAQGAKRPSRRRAAPTPSPRQRERAHRQNTPRAGYTPGRSRAPAMAPTLLCPRVGAPLEHPRALQRRFLPLQPPFRSGLSYSALGCARGALGAPRGGRAEEGTPRAAPPARGTSRPPPPHTGCRASLSRKRINAVRAGPARVAWPRRPPLGKRVCHRDSHQGNSHKTRCEAARRGRKHLLGLTGLRVVTDRRSGGSRGALRGRDMAPGGPLHGALCGGGALFPPEGPQTLYCHPTFW
jgi:hypothetical protein